MIEHFTPLVLDLLVLIQVPVPGQSLVALFQQVLQALDTVLQGPVLLQPLKDEGISFCDIPEAGLPRLFFVLLFDPPLIGGRAGLGT